jgi:glutaredoxin
MLITFYKSAFCPRCYFARKYLHEITASNPEIQVIEVDVLTAPQLSWRNGIRMIPALKINERILSALFISRKDIAAFIAGNTL